MFKKLDWAAKRRIIYIAIIVLSLIIFSVYSLRNVIWPNPTCFDGKQNGMELGIDCGGGCHLKCQMEYQPLTVSATRAIKRAEGSYSLLAVIANPNTTAAPRSLNVSLDIYNDAGNYVETITNDYPVSTGHETPIYISDYRAESVSRVVARINPYQMYGSRGGYLLRLRDFTFTNAAMPDDISRLSVRYQSPYAQTINGTITVMVSLLDSLGNIVDVQSTTIPGLFPERIETINLTWPYQMQQPIYSVSLTPIVTLYDR